MKDEEFNDFLRNRAEQFEMKPSSGSFGAVMGKMQKTRKKSMVWVLLPLLFVSAIVGYTFIENHPKQIAKGKENTPPSVVLPADKAIANNTPNAPGQTSTGTINEIVTSEPLPVETRNAAKNNLPLPIQPKITTEAIVEISRNELATVSLVSKKPVLPTVSVDNTIKLFPVEAPTLLSNTKHPNNKTVRPPNCEEKNAVQVSFTQYYVKSGNVNTDEAYKDIIATQAKTSVIGQAIPNFQQSYPPVKTSEIVWRGGFGINAAYRGVLSKKWGIQVGLSYSLRNTTQSFNEYTEFWDTASVERLNPITNTKETVVERTSFWTKSASAKYTSRLQTLSIPLSIYYKLVSNCKWGLEVSGGAAYNYQGASTTYETVVTPAFNSGNKISPLTYTTSYFSALAGFTGHYYLTKKIGVFTGFRSEIPLQPLYTTPYLKSPQKLSLLGIDAGIRFKF